MNEPFHIDNFEIIDRLGVGGMATVWKARQSSLDRYVAIKVLAPHFATDPADIARFRAEACAAGRLKHSGLVQVYDANFKDGLYYFVMELVDGYTIGEWIRRKGRLTEADALAVAESVAMALDYAWTTCGIIHCDIKPDNIMVDADGTLKITDLGLARAISNMQPSTVEQDVLGTPAYMTPEQVTGLPDLDCRADIYALGATLYHMVTGHLLFAGDASGDDDVMQKQLVSCVPNPTHEVPELTRPFVRLLCRMLIKDRNDRPRDWKVVLEDLRRVRNGHLPAGSEPSPGASTIFLNVDESDTVRLRALEAPAPAAHPVRDRLQAAATLLVIAAAIGGSVWFLVQRLQAGRQAPLVAAPLDSVHATAPAVPPQPTPAPAPPAVAPSSALPVATPPVAADAVAPHAAPAVVPAHQPPAHLSVAEAVRRLARTALRKNVAAARQQADVLAGRDDVLAGDADFIAVTEILTQAVASQQSVLDSFGAESGKTVTVALLQGAVTGTIRAVEPGGVHVTLPDGADRVLTADDLDMAERLKRLARSDEPGTKLLKGLWACRSHAISRARDLFSGVPPPLGPALMRGMDE